MRHVLSFVLVWTLIGCFSASAEETCDLRSEREQRLHAFLKGIPLGSTNAYDVAKKYFILNPAEQLRPGDIILLRDEHGISGNAAVTTNAGGNLFDGYVHASLVAKGPDGNLFTLSTPHEVTDNFSASFVGFRYYAVRPKIPKGQSREEFEAAVSKVAIAFNHLPIGFDSLLGESFMDEKTIETIRKKVEDGELKKEDIPALYCTAVTQLILAVAKGRTAKPVTALDLIDKATESLRKDYQAGKLSDKELASEVNRRVREIARIDEWEKTIAKNKADIKKVEEDLKSDNLGAEVKQSLQTQLEKLKGEQKEAKETLQTNRFAAFLAEFLVKERAKGKPGLATLALTNTSFGQKKVIRPIDILNEAFTPDGAFVPVGFYPGELTSCIDKLFDFKSHKNSEPAQGEEHLK